MRKTKPYKTLNYLLLVRSPIQDLTKWGPKVSQQLAISWRTANSHPLDQHVQWVTFAKALPEYPFLQIPHHHRQKDPIRLTKIHHKLTIRQWRFWNDYEQNNNLMLHRKQTISPSPVPVTSNHKRFMIFMISWFSLHPRHKGIKVSTSTACAASSTNTVWMLSRKVWRLGLESEISLIRCFGRVECI